MALTRKAFTYTPSSWLTMTLFGALVCTFALYVHAENEIDRANDSRHQSQLLAVELRQSSDDLTRMVRSYVATGNSRYKQYYQDILAIRNGQMPRPPSYQNAYWDLVLVSKQPRDSVIGEKITLLDLMRQANFTESELHILSGSKAYSDQLTATEFAAMALSETPGPAREVTHQQALNLLFNDPYNLAKVEIMRGINQFYGAMDKRTTEAVKQAEYRAFEIRLILIGLGLSLIYMLWCVQDMLFRTLGGTLDEVHRHIARIGSGDFITANVDAKDSVLGWLDETQHKLSQLQQARLQAEETLRCSEENLSITLQSIGDAVIATDSTGLITRMNPTAERLTGWLLAQACDRQLSDIFQIVNAKSREHLSNPVQMVMAHGQVVGLANHTVLIARDGSEYQISDSAAPIRDSLGKTVGIVLVFSDVSEKYKAEEALREKEWLLSESQRIAHIGSWSFNIQTNKITWSEETYRIYGVSPETFVPTRESFISLIHPDDLSSVLKAIGTIEAGNPSKNSFRIITPSGDIRFINGYSELFPASLSAPARIAGTAQDVTEQRHADERFHNIFRLIPNSLTLQTMQGVVLDCSNTFCEMTGFSREEVLSQDAQVLNVWVNHEQRMMFREILLRDGQIDNFEFQLRRRNGDIRTMQISARQLTLGSAVPVILSVAHDITERKIAELAVQESAFHTQAILDNMFDGVITINIKGVIESINKAASNIFGFSHDEVVGHNITTLMPLRFQDQHNAYLQLEDESLGTPVVNTLREVEGQRKDGNVFPMSLSISKVMRDNRITFVGVIRDISQQRQDEEEIHHLAFYDALTNLPNRRLLFDRLQQAILTSSRTDQHGALMFLDLDHFKQLNDTLGHDIGDVLLQQVAHRLHACVREGDSVARMGGDEFVVLIESLSIYPNEAAAQTELIADKILAGLGEPYYLREHTYLITPSIGIVVFLHQTETMEELLKKADVAMYQAKTAGRNNARFFDPAMQAAVSMRIHLEADMHRALEQHEFILHYQLQVDGQGNPTGVEALVRWNHSENGMISPAAFIPLAEETGS